jgi:hypothetical protein
MIRTVTALAIGLLWSGAALAQTSDNAGSFEALSPGNQDHASALVDAHLEFKGAAAATLTTGDIAGMRADGKGWGQIFAELQASGQIGPEVKNFGQLVSDFKHAEKGITPGSDVVITTGAGHKISTGRGQTKNKVGGTKTGLGHGGAKDKGIKLGGSTGAGHGAGVVGITTAGGQVHGSGKALGHTKTKAK